MTPVDMDVARQCQARQIRGLLAGYAVWGAFWGSWGALLPAIKTRVGASDAVLGAVLLCVAAGALPAMRVVGPLVDRFGQRALVASLGLFALSIPGLALAQSPVALGVALLLVGASSGAVDVALNAGVAVMEAATGRRLFHQAHAAFPLAVVIASPTVGLARQAGAAPTTILVVIAAVVLAVALANTIGRRPTARHRGDRLRRPPASRLRSQPRLRAPQQRPRTPRALLLLGAVGAGIHVIENAVEQWSAIFLEHGLGAVPAVASLGPAVYMGMLFAGRMLAHACGPWLSAQLGARFDDRHAIAITGLSAAAGMVVVASAPHPAVALAGFAVAGLGMATGIPTIFGITGRAVAEAERAAAISTVTVVAYAGYLLGPPLVGGLADVIGLRATWLALAAGALVLAAAGRSAVPAAAAPDAAPVAAPGAAPGAPGPDAGTS